MQFLVDANLSPRVAAGLISAGFDSVHVTEVGLLTASDQAILDYAAENGLVIVSADTDFGELLALSRGAIRPSAVLLRSADLVGLWRAIAAGLLGDDDFEAFAGELFLALLLDADEVAGSQIKAAAGLAVAEEGFRDSRTGEPPDEHAVSWAVHATSNLCRALGLLAVGSDWSDRGYGLTGTGRATALAALRARAAGPRTIPWP